MDAEQSGFVIPAKAGIHRLPPWHYSSRISKGLDCMAVLQPCVYLLASRRNGVLYVGVTSNLPQRIWQHRNNVVAGFTSRYRVQRLVWFEQHETMESAILREKAIKEWQRHWKRELIEASNPYWRDLYPEICLA